MDLADKTDLRITSPDATLAQEAEQPDLIDAPHKLTPSPERRKQQRQKRNERY